MNGQPTFLGPDNAKPKCHHFIRIAAISPREVLLFIQNSMPIDSVGIVNEESATVVFCHFT